MLVASLALAISLVTPAPSRPEVAQEHKWERLFNGRDLSGWTAKIKGYDLGENFGDTFRVADGAIQVSYDKYGGKFDGRFGHLYFERPYSNYKLRLEYRFVGEQIADGPGWAWRNSGVMIHCQDPKTIRKDQDFPVSAEVQFLGGPEKETRHTANLCTPGTNVMMGGRLVTQHCNDSTSETYRGDQWVKVEIEVHGSGLVVHRVEGRDVLSYEGIHFDASDSDAKDLIGDGPLMIEGGYIALQSESHPCEFRNIEILNLEK